MQLDFLSYLSSFTTNFVVCKHMAASHILGLLIIIIPQVLSIDTCMSHTSCVAIKNCRSVSEMFLYPCHAGLNYICCPDSHVVNTTSIESRKSSLFPKECGVVLSVNKITGGKNASLGEFPWMALLGYTQRGFAEFLCGGTIITSRYVMTAAHCISIKGKIPVNFVRLGEHNIDSDEDCVIQHSNKVCSDKPIDINVEKRMIHPDYNSTTLKNDIGLLRLELPIPNDSDYIKPICLPFDRNFEGKDFTGERFTITGWGKTDPKILQGSSWLQFAHVEGTNQEKCNNNLPPIVRNLSDAQLCAIGKKEDACKGDSGGPLSNVYGVDDEIRTYQIGIVSFSPTPTCGIRELPPVYTRVDKYLKWIKETVEV